MLANKPRHMPTGSSYLWEALPVKGHRVEQLPKRKRLQHPAPEPPRPLPHPLTARLEPPDEPAVFRHVPGELQRAEDGHQGDGHAELLGGEDAEHEARKGGADGWGVGGGEGGGGARVAQAEGARGGVEEVCPEAGEEAEEEAVEKEDCGQGEGQTEGLGLVEGLLLRRGGTAE